MRDVRARGIHPDALALLPDGRGFLLVEFGGADRGESDAKAHDWILRVGLAYSVFALTGSTLVSAATLLASFLPQVLLGSIAGVFVDRWRRKAAR